MGRTFSHVLALSGFVLGGCSVHTSTTHVQSARDHRPRPSYVVTHGWEGHRGEGSRARAEAGSATVVYAAPGSRAARGDRARKPRAMHPWKPTATRAGTAPRSGHGRVVPSDRAHANPRPTVSTKKPTLAKKPRPRKQGSSLEPTRATAKKPKPAKKAPSKKASIAGKPKPTKKASAKKGTLARKPEPTKKAPANEPTVAGKKPKPGEKASGTPKTQPSSKPSPTGSRMASIELPESERDRWKVGDKPRGREGWVQSLKPKREQRVEKLGDTKKPAKKKPKPNERMKLSAH